MEARKRKPQTSEAIASTCSSAKSHLSAAATIAKPRRQTGGIRRGVGEGFRDYVLARDGLKCHYCGREFPRKTHWLTIDHIDPVAKGGTDDDESNFVVACRRCNSSKGALPLDVWLATHFKKLYGLSSTTQRKLKSLQTHDQMNKTDAAKYLGIGVRTLERYTSEGRVVAQKVRSSSGTALDYEQPELDRFKAQLSGLPQVLHFPITAELQAPPPAPPPTSTALAIAPQVLASRQRPGVVVPVEVLAELAQALSDAQKKPHAATADKLLLNLEEAQVLTGLSRPILRQAIEAGDLAARKIGRSWRVKRADLEEFVRNL